MPCVTESRRRYDVTITVDQDGSHLPNLAEARNGGRAGSILQGALASSRRRRPSRSSAPSPSRKQTSPLLGSQNRCQHLVWHSATGHTHSKPPYAANWPGTWDDEAESAMDDLPSGRSAAWTLVG